MRPIHQTLGTRIFTAFAILILMLTAMPVSPAYAATAGPNNAGAGVNVNGPGTVNWTNPGNVVSDNGANATVTVNGTTSEYLQATGYGFAIPSTATIDGITVTIGRFGTTGGGSDVRDSVVSLVKGGVITGSNLANGGADWPNAEAAANYGGVGNLWGTTWTPAEVNAANFGVVLSVTSANFRTASVDYIQVTVTYTLPTTTVGDGTSPANKSVSGSETNRAVSAFTLSTNSGSDTVTGLVITGTNLLTNVTAVTMYQSANSEWEAGDTLIATVAPVGNTATFTGLTIPVTTTVTNYIITYNISATPTNGQTLTAAVTGVTATNPITNNDATDATITIDTAAPTVADVDAPTNGAGTYGIGDTITVRVIFSEAVTVTGTPQLTLETGAVDRVLNYSGMSGATGLLFTYVVQAGDVSADLDYVAINSLALNGGTIRDAALNNATLTLPAPMTPGSGSLGDNEALVIDGIAPTVTINQAAGQIDPATSQPINFTVVFSEAITGFTGGDITLTGTAGGLGGATRNITGAGPTYTVSISGLTSPGTVIATIAAGAVQDNPAGNGNTVSTSTDNSVTISGFTITTSAGTGGTIVPPGPVTVLGGGGDDFDIVPNTGYIVNNVQLDSGSLGSLNYYSFINVTTNHTLSATFDPGWRQPSGTANLSGWNNPNNAFTSNNSYATSDALNGVSVDYNGFGIVIPAGSTIDGIEVAIEGNTQTINPSISVSSDGVNFTTPRTLVFTANDSTVRTGGPTDLWSWSWPLSTFTNFTVRVTAPAAGFSTVFEMDQLQVKVHYTPPPLLVTINQAVGQLDPTNASPINFTVVFNYPVSDFATGDVTLSGTAGATTAVVTGSGTTYNVAVSGMTGDGTVTASLATGVATNVNGTLNSPSTSTDNTVTYDGTPPTATIDLQDTSDSGISITDDITNATSPVFDVTFSEDLLSAPLNGDFSNAGTATGCTFTVGALSGNTYPVTASGCSAGTLILRLAANAVTDTSTNPNAQTDGPTVTIDRTGPDVTINQAVSQLDPTGASPINFTAVFTEATYGFTGLDVSLSGTANPTVANVTGGPTTFNVAVSNMTTSGTGFTVIASIGAGVATDAAGNPNTASTSTDNTVEYNSNAPIVSINLQSASDSGISNVDNVTNVASPILDISFDEPVSGLANGDFSNTGTATGCTFALGAPTGNTYPVTVSGCSDGTLIVRLAAGAVQNGTLIPNAQTTGPTITIDRTAPTVTINQAVGQPDPTNLLPISFTAAFSETVYNFTAGDVTLVAPVGASATLIGAGPTYGVDVSGLTVDGVVTASIGANVATDAAGNNNTASTSTDNQVTYDTVAPTVTINQAGGQLDPTNTSPINFTVVFSEAVTGFATGDVTLTGTAGATNAVVTGGPTTYTVAVSGMTGSGTVIADLAASVATDLAGNDSPASTSTDNTVTYDITQPTVTIDQAIGQADPTNVSPIHFTAEFSKPINPATFTSADITLSSGTATITQVNATTFDISVAGMVQGPLTASIPAGGISDFVGNTNTASTSSDNVVVYDTIAPTVTINQAGGQADPTNVSPIHFTAIFSEPVNGFIGTDVTLSSGTATVTGGPTVYDVSVTGMIQGVLTATIPAGGVTDDVGIANTASTSTDNSVLYDTVVPTVTVNQEATQADPTNTGPINFTVVFSEPVTGFTNADLVGNFGGTAAPSTAIITTGSGTTYNVAISGMAANGTVTLSLPAAVAQDATGNNNSASTSTDNTVTYDTTPPSVTINQAAAQADPTSTSPINFTVVFSEPVTGLTSADINLTGTAGPTTAVVTGGPTTYNVAVSGMTGSGTVTAFVLVNAAQDAANNSSFASTSLDNTVTYDISVPTVTINQDPAQTDPTGTSPINFQVVFNKPMDSVTFTGADVALSGTATGTLTAVITGSGTTYNVAVSGMTGSGTVIATIPAGGVQDTAGNSNLASTSVDNTVTFDATPPTVTVNQALSQADPTNGAPIDFTVIFSEAVTGFTNADVFIGGTATGTMTAVVTGGGTTYNVAVSGMTGSGTVTLAVPVNSATDVSGNGNTASTSTDNTVTYDVTAPTVTINQAGAQADPTGASPINFTVVFSEPVTGFANTDVTLTGTAGAATVVVSGGGTTYNVAVSGMVGSGTVIATVNAGAATDVANNTSLASTSTDNQVTYDAGIPLVTVNQAVAQADPTNAGPINFTVVFSEPVFGFTNADVVLSGTATGTLTAVVTGAGPTYNVAVSGMTGSGTVIATIPAGAVQDSAANGNTNSTSTDNTVTYDVTAPTVTVNQAAGQVDPTNASPIDFTVVFSEPVLGFTNADVTISGTAAGTLTAAVTGAGPTYNVAVSGMTGPGTVILTIGANVVTDAAGNNNTASTSTDNTVTFDNAALTVTINQAAGQVDPTNASPINFTVVFSKPVTGFTNTDVLLSGTAGATTVNVTGTGANYNVAVSGMANSGTVIATIPASAAQDASSNPNAASTSTDNSVLYDNTIPTVTINQAGAQADPTNASPINFTVVFSEPVTGFTNAGIALSGTAGATTAAVTGTGTTYNVAVSGMAGPGTVIATVAAGNAQDASGNGNANSTSTDNTVTYDNVAPTVTVNQAAGQADPTNASPIDFTVVFSEPVLGFAPADITLGGTAGATTAVITGAGPTYNVAVSGMTSSGTVIVTLGANVVTDAAGSNNTASTSTDNTVTFDNSTLTVTINQAAGQVDPTNTSPINFTVVFNKPVTGFTNGDVLLSGTAGATTVNVTGTGANYNVAVSGMVGSGTVITNIPAGAAQDASSNPNAASTSTDNSVTYDNVIPTVTINQAAGQADPTNASPIDFTVVFSEPVTGFTGADVALGGTAGATTAVVTGTGTTYNVAVSGMAGSGTVTATVGAGNAQDASGNGNANSTSTDNTVTYDNVAPTVTVNQAAGQADPTNASPIDFTVVFSEPVLGFAPADITLTGTAGATTAVITGAGPTYNVAVSGMTGSGTVIVTIGANVVTDTSGSNNTASTSTDNTVTFDNAALTVTIDQAAAQADPTNTSPINFTVVFSKPVTGFTNADVLLSGTAGATTVNVTGTGANYNVAVSGMTNAGTVVANIPAGAAQDASSNANSPSTSTDNSVTFDNNGPTVTINQAAGQADPTNGSPINFTVIFSESVTGFNGSDVALTGTAGATTAVVTGSGTTYTVAVSGMTGSGTVIATVPAGNAQDAAGNGNANSTSTDNTVTYDFDVPAVTINQAAGQADPTSASPISFDVVFSKPVTGFTNADVILGGTAGATTVAVTGSGTTYTVAVSGMASNGTVTATIPAGVALDSVGNPNVASTSTDNIVTYDTVGSTVTINQAATQVDPTGTSPINFTAVFSEPVTGFTNADLNIGGTAGATNAVVTGSGTTYNVAVSGMSVSGTVFVTITDTAAFDTAGNPSAASTSTDNVVTYDTGAPSVTINQAAGQADPTNASPIKFTVVFSKPVTGFTSADVVLTGTAGATTAVVSGTGANYTVEVSGMAGSGTVVASIPAGRAQDSASNSNLASTSTDNSVQYDVNDPTVTVNQAATQFDPTNLSPINFTAEFSESVVGFTSADVTIGGTAGATTAVVTGSGATYNIAISGMVTDGTVTASIGAAIVVDEAGNSNSASTSRDNEVTYNTNAPTVTIEQAAGQADPTNQPTIDFTVTFSELVIDFTNSDVTLSGTAGATTVNISGAGPVYTVTVSGMTNDGTVIASIPAGAVTDPSNNPNTASTSVDNIVTYLDGTGPSVTVINTVPETPDHVLTSGELVTFAINQFTVKFNQDVFNPQGDSDPEDATNPNNYLLIRDLGETPGLQTVSCVAGAVTPADTKIQIGTVTYDSATNTATFAVNGGLPLSNGDYHLFVCGTTSIVDPIDHTLALVGSSGLPGSDYRHSFTITADDNGGGGDGDDDEDTDGNGNAGNSSSASTQTNSLIPVTGFIPDVVTTLPEQPATLAYKDIPTMKLEIPSLSVNVPIVGVNKVADGWDLTWLGNNAGYLEGSAYPTWQGNTVLTGHVLDAKNVPGPFAYIKELKPGERVYIHYDGWTYVYQVEKSFVVSYSSIDAVFKHEEYSWLTLVTCENYSETREKYLSRRIVRAVLISVIADQ